jgi:hypothetical protein
MRKLILLLLLIATPCLSQEMRDVPKRKIFDKKFWLATAVVVGTTVLDIEMTARCVRSHTCVERNPLWGRNPSRAKMYGIKGSLAGFTIWSTWWWKRDDMRKMERYEFRNDPKTPEPRIWERPTQRWYLPALIYGGVTGGASIYNLSTQQLKTIQPAQPMRLPGNATQP